MVTHANDTKNSHDEVNQKGVRVKRQSAKKNNKLRKRREKRKDKRSEKVKSQQNPT